MLIVDIGHLDTKMTKDLLNQGHIIHSYDPFKSKDIVHEKLIK